MRFLTGDELGTLKVLHYSLSTTDVSKATLKTIQTGSAPIQRLCSSKTSSGSTLVAAAHGDGLTSSFFLQDDDSLQKMKSWAEPRLKVGQRYVGLAVSDHNVFSCTSNGAIRRTRAEDTTESTEIADTTLVPTGLLDWKLSPTCRTFAYGGDEVDLSVWDVEKALQSSSEEYTSSTKRKRSKDTLFSAEQWRAKNSPNDSLGLRKPIRITSLTYLSSDNHLLTGTQLGDVRRYDTRAARRPVTEWKSVAKLGGVKTVERGLNEHEVFVSDGGTSLYSLDLRNGRTLYGYKGLAGSVTSIAAAPSTLGSAAQDRYIRVHSTFPPAQEVGQPQEGRGEVLGKVYSKSIPTCIVWDGTIPSSVSQGDEDSDDDMWENMENIGNDSDDNGVARKKTRIEP
ncbi:hypothetical protein VKT23_004149 [Stygiomarasmius scandens]|uniref:Ribosome biogenesis protein NSA1 n=1 Tax=Marasmiellus scandens TaxID=2682957 RepID=A0ABR1JZ47_9AGAR